MIRFEDIQETVQQHHPDADLEILRKAYIFSAVEHKGQVRASGEPYLVHPLEVAAILAEMRMDPICVAAGLLHDVVEDTLTTPERLQEYFGADVLHIVEGVTKISQDRVRHERGAPGRDLPQDDAGDGRRHPRHPGQAGRPPAQHAHAGAPARGRQQRIARETLEIYAPDRPPSRHGQDRERARGPRLPLPRPRRPTSALRQQVEARRKQADAFIDKIRRGRRPEAAARPGSRPRSRAASSACTRSTRSCSASSIDLDQVYDFVRPAHHRRTRRRTATRRSASSTTSGGRCRGASRISSPCPGPNFYQSLHTSVISEDGQPFEVQIRTEEMHRIAEEGIAAHWKYKEGRTGVDKDDQRLRLAAAAGRVAAGGQGPPRVPVLAEARPLPGGGVQLHAQGQGDDAAARRHARSTSPTRSTPRSATSAWARGSTARWCRCATSSRTATSSRS